MIGTLRSNHVTAYWYVFSIFIGCSMFLTDSFRYSVLKNFICYIPFLVHRRGSKLVQAVDLFSYNLPAYSHLCSDMTIKTRTAIAVTMPVQ